MKKIIFILLVLIAGQSYSQEFLNLAVGENAIDFKLKTVQGDEIQLSQINKDHQVVLVVLRGWPEYQCPICSRQVGQFIAEAGAFEEKGAAVLLVYPGPSEVLQEKAVEFSEDFQFPDNFYFLLDPDYSMVNKYGLRWDAPRETAYPSSFVINKASKIVFSKISQKHGGRSNVDELLEAL